MLYLCIMATLISSKKNNTANSQFPYASRLSSLDEFSYISILLSAHSEF